MGVSIIYTLAEAIFPLYLLDVSGKCCTFADEKPHWAECERKTFMGWISRYGMPSVL